MGEPIEERRGHLGVAEHAGPLAEAEVGCARRRACVERPPDNGAGRKWSAPAHRAIAR